MAELELSRLHEDAERLVLRGPDGVEHTLAISEALRAAVRRDRPRTEALRAESEASLRPREVQARLRAGATVEELATASGLPVENVRRYEWPVIAERNHVVGQVRDHRFDPEAETTLGDLADARLAARGVSPDDAEWTARRHGNAPWEITVRFTAGDRERFARWSFDPRGRTVVALDDESRWLGQPDDPVSPEILGVPARQTAPRSRPAPEPDATSVLLDDLADRRGQRPAGRARRADEPQPDELPLDLRGPDDSRTASVVDLGARRGARHSEADDEEDDGTDDGTDEGTDDVAASTETQAPAAPSTGISTTSPAPTADTETGTGAQTATDDDSRAAEPNPSAHDAAAPARTHTAPGDLPATPHQPDTRAPRRGGRKGRAQVPSWDEIVFGGARPSS